MFGKFYKASLFGCLAMCASGAMADDFINLTNLAKANRIADVFITNSNEIAIPRIFLFDTDGDPYTDVVKLRLDVYEAGTKNLIQSTQLRQVPLPDLPCTTPDPDFSEVDFDVSFRGDPNKNRVAVIMNAWASCWDTSDMEFKETYQSALYSGHVANGTSWLRAWPLDMIGMNGIDYDDDAANEYTVALLIPNPDGSERVRIMFLDTSDGSVDNDLGVAADSVYPLTTIK